ncbi:MAG: hypothetical protein OES13_00380 [Acidimicrobiia bacterium]|nr:hypothetical protein [Acidimicrobiia bacterium]
MRAAIDVYPELSYFGAEIPPSGRRFYGNTFPGTYANRMWYQTIKQADEMSTGWVGKVRADRIRAKQRGTS